MIFLTEYTSQDDGNTYAGPQLIDVSYEDAEEALQRYITMMLLPPTVQIVGVLCETQERLE